MKVRYIFFKKGRNVQEGFKGTLQQTIFILWKNIQTDLVNLTLKLAVTVARTMGDYRLSLLIKYTLSKLLIFLTEGEIMSYLFRI